MADQEFDGYEEEELNELRRNRLDKLEQLRERGIDPWGQRYERTHVADEIERRYACLEDSEVALAGRLMAFRVHGKACFADLQDSSGRVQLYASVDDLGEERYQLFTDLDIGDFIGLRGVVFKTRRGEATVRVHEFTFLSKALRPLPEKWHGLRDVDIRYRRRYVDLMVNPDVREAFITRSKIIAGMRRFLDEEGFLEVETPVLHTVAGGTTARPFRTHHNALDMDIYLRIATELYLKRLVVGGLEKVYEIGKVFRNEGLSTNHNPEFTLLEVYEAYADYRDMMELTENMVAEIAERVLGDTEIEYQGEIIDLKPPWRRVSMVEKLREEADIDLVALESALEARQAARRQGVPVDDDLDLKKTIERLVDYLVEPELIQPTFLLDHPVELSPLAKRKEKEPRLTYRFEPVIAGMEIGNAFSEINDPIEQRNRFEKQAERRAQGDEEAHRMDEDFVRSLEYGMPPTGGLGIGVDRLVMLLTDAPSIRDVILFPLMRPEE